MHISTNGMCVCACVRITAGPIIKLRDQAGSRSLVFDLAIITHDRFASSSQPQQNGSLTHPQDLDAPVRIAAQRKINSDRQQYA